MNAEGEPAGIAPDLAREIAARLSVPIAFVTFGTPAEVADAAQRAVWDIALIAKEPARAENIAFSPAYVEIEATFLVPSESSIATIADVDRPGRRISVMRGSAYDLWLTRHFRHAEIVRAASLGDSLNQFVSDRLDTLAGLRPGLLLDLRKLPGARILDGNFTAVQQAVGTLKRNKAGAEFLCGFVIEAKSSGLVEGLIERHQVLGLSVAS
jgi:polar amino acid transport system substrate-binding protein